MDIIKKIFKLIEWIVFLTLIFILFLVASPLLPTKTYISTHVVSTGSMEPEIMTGSVVFSTLKNDEVNKGDVVVFKSPDNEEITVMHRVMDIQGEEYTTKGDNNEKEDSWVLFKSNILGTVIFTIPYLGYVIDFMKTPLGFGLVLGIPALLLILSFIRRIKDGINDEVKRKTEEEIFKHKIQKEKEPPILPLILLISTFFFFSNIPSAYALFSSTVSITGMTITVGDIEPNIEDLDNDGVSDDEDMCLGTQPETFSLGTNRVQCNNHGQWQEFSPGGHRSFQNYTIEDTYGCNCTQILEKIEELTGDSLTGHRQFGCSQNIVRDFIADLEDGIFDGYDMTNENDSVFVPATILNTLLGYQGVNSNITTHLGRDYRLFASGTYRFASWGNYGIADAEWSFRSAPYTQDGTAGWVKGEGYFASACGLDVQVDGCVDWGDLSTSNEYLIEKEGTGLPFYFEIFDNVYTDNTGGIDIDIFKFLY